MRNFFTKVAFVALGLISISCSNENDLLSEEDGDSEITIVSEVYVDGKLVTNTKAASTAGYTTGDGLYHRGDDCIVKAVANSGYELVSFDCVESDKWRGNNSSYTFRVPGSLRFQAKFQTREIQPGDIYCSDHSIISYAKLTSGETTLDGKTPIGIIAWINPNANEATKGWVISLKTLTSDMHFNGTGFNSELDITSDINNNSIFCTQDESEAKSYLDGEKLTQFLKNRIDPLNPAMQFSIASACENYSIEGVGAGSWYLPSLGQLNLIVQNATVIEQSRFFVAYKKVRNWETTDAELTAINLYGGVKYSSSPDQYEKRGLWSSTLYKPTIWSNKYLCNSSWIVLPVYGNVPCYKSEQITNTATNFSNKMSFAPIFEF